MNKLPKLKVSKASLVSLLLLLAFSCQQQLLPHNDVDKPADSTNNLTIADARTYYDQQLLKQNARTSAGKKPRYKKTILWQYAAERKDKDDQTVVVVPLIADNGQDLMTSGFRRLITWKVKNKTHSAVLEVIGRTDYLQQNRLVMRAATFTGLIFVRDLDDNLIEGWLINEGQVGRLARLQSDIDATDQQSKTGRLANTPCGNVVGCRLAGYLATGCASNPPGVNATACPDGSTTAFISTSNEGHHTWAMQHCALIDAVYDCDGSTTCNDGSIPPMSSTQFNPGSYINYGASGGGSQGGDVYNLNGLFYYLEGNMAVISQDNKQWAINNGTRELVDLIRTIGLHPEANRQHAVNNTITLLRELLGANNFLLRGCDLSLWAGLSVHTPPASVRDRLRSLTANAPTLTSTNWNWFIQTLESAAGKNVNMDYFPVQVQTLPTDTLNNRQLTADEFLNHIRKNINTFVDNSLSSFQPHPLLMPGEDSRWNSFPLGAILSIGIPFDPGSVVCSAYQPSSWIFTTIHDPIFGDHPVAGNRQFSYTQNGDGSYTFYTKGVDRIYPVLQATIGELSRIVRGEEIQFSAADNLWNSFQNGIQNFVNQHGGQAQKQPATTRRMNYALVRDVLLGKKSVNDIWCR